MNANQPILGPLPVLSLDIKKFVNNWNARYPIDRYIRKKYNIPFGSPAHRALDFISMTCEFVEDRLAQTEERESMQLTEADLPMGEVLNRRIYDENQAPAAPIKMKQKEIDTEFENLDLSKF